MNGPLELLQAYFRRGVVVDSNLLVLFFLGGFDRSQIDKNPRLEKYSPDDFELLIKLLDKFRVLVTTPHVLTEVSNLSNAVPEGERKSYFESIASRVTLLEERHVACSTALAGRWERFGLTDAAIATIAENQLLVLTDDFRLSQVLQSEGIDSLNFNHLRQIYWQSEN
jgi:rRNA-processing protein FCF1